MIKNRTQLQSDVDTLLPDNVSELITPALHREVEGNILDSNLNVIDTIQYKVFSLATPYVVGDLVIYFDTIYRCIVNSLGNLPTDFTYFVAVAAPLSTETNVGLVRRATSVETVAGTNNFAYVTPAGIVSFFTGTTGGAPARVIYTTTGGIPSTTATFGYTLGSGGRISYGSATVGGQASTATYGNNGGINFLRPTTDLTLSWRMRHELSTDLVLAYGTAGAAGAHTTKGTFRNDTGVYVPTTNPQSNYHYYWSGNVTTTTTVAATPTKVLTSNTVAGYNDKFTVSTGPVYNRATCTNPIANLWYSVACNFSFVSSASTVLYAQLYKNGVAVAGTRTQVGVLAGTIHTIGFVGTVQLSNTDYIEVYITTDDPTNTTVYDLTITGHNLSTF